MAHSTGPSDSGLKQSFDLRLAHMPGVAPVDDSLKVERERLPALLVSFVFVDDFVKKQHLYHYRDWVMDSGAFSAMNSGIEIPLDEYIRACHKLKDSDPTLTEIYALDVIGDWKQTLKNTEKMWEAGIEAIPTFHVHSPKHVLLSMVKDYPKIAVGGLIPLHLNDKCRWLDTVFSTVWPKRIHGFACTSRKLVLSYPFHSVDSTSWEIGACKYGMWRSIGVGRLSVRGSNQNLRCEINRFLDLEEEAQRRWRKEMELLDKH